MRIGYLTYGLDRAHGGIARYTVGLLRALATLADKPEIVLLTTEREDRHGLWNLFEHHALPGCRLLPALMTMGHWLLSQAVHRYKLDVIHDPNGIAPFLGPRMGACRVVTLHDAFAYVHPGSQNWLDNWRYRYQLPIAARRADVVITVSECSRHDLIRSLKLSSEQTRVIAEGIASQFHSIADSSTRQTILNHYKIKSPYLLYVGGINARKNIARLLEAYARVRQRRPEITLVLGGKRQWKTDEIDATLGRLNLEKHVRFTGYIADADLPALYSAAQVFVFPSLYEGFGLPPLEAMACGTPVITSNCSSLPEVAGDAALTVDPYNVEELAAAIERLLVDNDLHADLRRRGIERAAQFTWAHAARETLAVYEQVLAEAQKGTIA